MNNKWKSSMLFSMFLTIIAVGLVLIVHSQQTSINSGKLATFKIDNSLVQLGIEIIHPSDSNFSTQLLNYTGGNPVYLDLAETVKPFAFFIKNNTPNDIVGISLKWTLVKNNGGKTTNFTEFVTPGILMGDKSVPANIISKYNLLNSGEMKFISYINSGVDEIIGKNQREKRISSTLNSDMLNKIRLTNLDLMEKLSNDFSEVNVSIDGIIFSDGGFVGRDENFFYNSQNGFLQARKDFISKVHKFKSEGKTENEILSLLLSNWNDEPQYLINKESENQRSNPKSAFDQAYAKSLFNIKKDLNNRKSKGLNFGEALKDFLLSVETDVVTLHKVN